MITLGCVSAVPAAKTATCHCMKAARRSSSADLVLELTLDLKRLYVLKSRRRSKRTHGRVNLKMCTMHEKQEGS
jgi:ribosomal protein L32